MRRHVPGAAHVLKSVLIRSFTLMMIDVKSQMKQDVTDQRGANMSVPQVQLGYKTKKK